MQRVKGLREGCDSNDLWKSSLQETWKIVRQASERGPTANSPDANRIFDRQLKVESKILEEKPQEFFAEL